MCHVDHVNDAYKHAADLNRMPRGQSYNLKKVVRRHLEDVYKHAARARRLKQFDGGISAIVSRGDEKVQGIRVRLGVLD